jgi:hypothetical protein
MVPKLILFEKENIKRNIDEAQSGKNDASVLFLRGLFVWKNRTLKIRMKDGKPM